VGLFRDGVKVARNTLDVPVEVRILVPESEADVRVAMVAGSTTVVQAAVNR
jgi:hypothetical protein